MVPGAMQVVRQQYIDAGTKKALSDQSDNLRDQIAMETHGKTASRQPRMAALLTPATVCSFFFWGENGKFELCDDFFLTKPKHNLR